jgi:hypothetical protein
MRRVPQLAITFMFLVLLLCARSAVAQQPPTLRQILKDKNVQVDSAALHNLDKRITSGADLDDSRQFVTAYYLENASETLDSPLYIDRFDRNSGKWQSARLDGADGKLSEDAGDLCFGSVLAVHSFGDYELLDTHINPSAGCTLIVSATDLHLKGSVYGWFLAGFTPNRIIYHRSEIHFAAVHPTEIALHDLVGGRDLTLFPQKPDQPVRAALIKRLDAFFSTHRDWCKEHDHPCDTEQIDSELVSEIAVNVDQDALAFVISYETQVFQPGEVQAPGGPKAVLYVYRNVSDDTRREFREILLPDENPPNSQADLAAYLTPGRLNAIFSTE